MSSKSGQNGDDVSDVSDLFLNSGFSLYPYREPRVDPTLALYQVPDTPITSEPRGEKFYRPRGGGVSGDWCVWDPYRLIPDTVDDYLSFADQCHPSLSQEHCLTLLRDCDYETVRAKRLLMAPVIGDADRSSQSWFRRPLNRHHTVGQPWSYVSAAGSLSDGEKEREVEIFTTQKRISDDADVDARREDLRRIFDLACDILQAVAPDAVIEAKAASVPSLSPVPPDDDESLAEPIDSELSLIDTSTPTNGDDRPRLLSTPLPVNDPTEIDVQLLRHVTQSLSDLPSPSSTVTAIISTLTATLTVVNGWLERVRPMLFALSKRSDGVTLAHLEELYQQCLILTPGVGSRDKKKLNKLIQKCQQWRRAHHRLFQDARLGGIKLLDTHTQQALLSVKLSLADVNKVLKEWEKHCSNVWMDTVGFYREAAELAKKFQSVVVSKLTHTNSGDGGGEKMSVNEAQSLIDYVTHTIPFVDMPELKLLTDEINAAKQWVASAHQSLVSLDAHDTEAVDECRALLQSSHTLRLSLTDIDTLAQQLEVKLWFSTVEQVYSHTHPGRGPLLDRLKYLLKSGIALGVSTDTPLYQQLVSHVTECDALVHQAQQGLNNKSKRLTLAQFQSLLAAMKALPVTMYEEVKVERVVKNTMDWQQSTLKLLASLTHTRTDTAFPLHTIRYEDVESLIARIGGKNIATVSAESPELAMLKLIAKCGKVWLNESTTCLKSLRTSGGGHGMLSRDYREKQMRIDRESGMTKLRQLLDVYDRTPSTHTLRHSNLTPSNNSATTTDSGSDSVDDFVSLDWSFLNKSKLPFADFHHAVAVLQLPFAQKLRDRLDEVAESTTAAQQVVAGHDGPLTLSELADIIYDLRRGGISEFDEPLLSLAVRYDIGAEWLKEVMSVLPVGCIPPEAVRKVKPRKREIRAKRSVTVPASKKKTDTDDGDDDEKIDTETDGIMDKQSSTPIAAIIPTTAPESDDEAEPEGEPERMEAETVVDDAEQSEDEIEYEYVSVVADHPPASFERLTELLSRFHTHTLEGKPPEVPPLPIESNARLDLVSLPELAYLGQSIDECRAWQLEAETFRELKSDHSLDALNALIVRGHALGVVMPEMAAMEATAWSQKWTVAVKLALAESLDLTDGIELLRQLKTRFPHYTPLSSVRVQIEEEERRTASVMQEVEEQEAREKENDEAEKDGREENSSMPTDNAEPHAATLSADAAESMVSEERTESADVPMVAGTNAVVSATHTTEPNLSFVDTDMAGEDGDDNATLHADNSDSSFLNSVLHDVHELELRVLREHTWLKRVNAIFHRRFGALMTRVALGPELPTLRTLIEDANTAEVVSTQTTPTANKVKKHRRQRTSTANTVDTAIDTTTTTTTESVNVDEIDFDALYCYCRRPFLPDDSMVSCDDCKQWYHYLCLNLTKEDAKKVERTAFICPECCDRRHVPYQYREKAPSMKKRVNGVRMTLISRLMATAPLTSKSEQRNMLLAILNHGLGWSQQCRALLESVTPPLGQARGDDVMETVLSHESAWQQRRDAIIARRRMLMEKRAEHAALRPFRNKSIKPKVTAATSEGLLCVVLEFESSASGLLVVRVAPATSEQTPAIVMADVVSMNGGANGIVDDEGATVVMAVDSTEAPATNAKERHNDRSGKHRASTKDDTSVPLIDSDVQAMIESERATRLAVLNLRAAYSDQLQRQLRLGLSIPMEIEERREVEDRVRLTLALEKAERTLIENTLPLKAQHALETVTVAHAHSTATTATINGKDTNTSTASLFSPSPSTTSIEKAVRKNELKHLQELHSMLTKCKAGCYAETMLAQNYVWPRFDRWFQSLIAFHSQLVLNLQQSGTPTSTPITFGDFLDCQARAKLEFAALSLPAFVETNLRVAAMLRWLPKEKKAFQKRLHASELTSLLSYRFKEVGNVHSVWTDRIVREMARVDDWNQRVEAAIEGKQGPQAFQQLVNEAQVSGPNALLVDESDIALAKQYSQLYCLCQQPYVDGVFMIGCDNCDDWFHAECVMLTVPQAKKIKQGFNCPRCCLEKKLVYPYGHIEGIKLKPRTIIDTDTHPSANTIATTTPTHSASVAGDDNETKKRKRKRERKKDADGNEIVRVKVEGEGEKKKVRKRAKKLKDGIVSKQSPTPETAGVKVEAAIVVAANGADGKKRKRNRKSDGGAGDEIKRRRKKNHDGDKDRDDKGEAKSQKRSRKSPATAPVSAPQSQPPLQLQLASLSPHTTQLYVNLLYEHLGPLVSSDHAAILYHLFNSYLSRPLDQRLVEEITEAIKLVAGEMPLNQVQGIVRQRFEQQTGDKETFKHVAIATTSQSKPGLGSSATPPRSNAGSPSSVGDQSGDRSKSKKRRRDKRRRDSSSSESSSADERSKKRKRDRRSKVPRKVRTAFDCFVHFVLRERATELAMLQTQAGLSGHAPNSKPVRELLQEQWHRLTNEERAPFEEQHRQDKDRYTREMALWSQRQPRGDREVASNSSEDEDSKPRINQSDRQPPPPPPHGLYAQPQGMPNGMILIPAMSPHSHPHHQQGFNSPNSTNSPPSADSSTTHAFSYPVGYQGHPHPPAHSSPMPMPMTAAIYPRITGPHGQPMIIHSQYGGVPFVPMVLQNGPGGQQQIVYVLPHNYQQQQQPPMQGGEELASIDGGTASATSLAAATPAAAAPCTTSTTDSESVNDSSVSLPMLEVAPARAASHSSLMVSPVTSVPAEPNLTLHPQFASSVSVNSHVGVDASPSAPPNGSHATLVEPPPTHSTLASEQSSALTSPCAIQPIEMA